MVKKRIQFEGCISVDVHSIDLLIAKPLKKH